MRFKVYIYTAGKSLVYATFVNYSAEEVQQFCLETFPPNWGYTITKI